MTNKELYKYVTDRFTYDRDTGIFWNKHKKTKAGCDQNGYLVVRIKGQNYYLHRLAWVLYYGTSPKNEIDHIDGNKHNNRIANLRDAPHRINCQNMPWHREGVLPGANWDPTRSRYRPRIRINGKRIRLGNYITAQEAHEVYMRACAKYGVTA